MLSIGKIPPDILDKIVLNPILDNGVKRQEVILRPKTGEDCTALSLGQDEIAVLSTDPITGATKDAGYLCVHVNCNDAAASGAEPLGILLTILLPEGSTEETLAELMQGVQRAALELNIEILGGHTEVTDAVNKPILSATVIGKTSKNRLIATGGAKVGQDVVMTKWAGLEGTSILAHDFEENLKSLLPPEIIHGAKEWKGFLSVVPEAKIATAFGATAMHDATEGGILGALWEVADCSGLGITVELEKILVKKETKLVCQATDITPYELMSSGTLVITTFDGEKLVQELKNNGIDAAVIGKMTEKHKLICENFQYIPLDQPQSDALYGVKINKICK